MIFCLGNIVGPVLGMMLYIVKQINACQLKRFNGELLGFSMYACNYIIFVYFLYVKDLTILAIFDNAMRDNQAVIYAVNING